MAINYKLIFIVLACCVSFESHALIKAVGLTNTIRTAVPGLTTRAKFVSTATGSVYTKVIDIGLASIGQVISKRAFSPWGVAVVAAVVAAGYLIDQNTGEVTSSFVAAGNFGDCRKNFSSDFWGNDTLGACDSFASNWWGITLTPEYESSLNDLHTYRLKDSTGIIRATWISSYPGTAKTIQEEIGGDFPALDTQLATDVLPLLSDAKLFDSMIDPVTGLPDQAITEIQDVATDIQTEEDLLNDGDPNNDPAVPSPTATIEEELLTDALSDAQEKEEQKDPCDDNPDRVGCLDAGTLPSDPSVQSEAIPFSVSQFSLSSNTSCPAPLTITLTKGYSIPFDFTSFCSFATLLNPIVSAVGFLIATMIVAGSVRNDGV